MVLIYKLELIPALSAHPFPKSFPNESSPYPYSSYYLVGLAIDRKNEDPQNKKKYDFSGYVVEFTNSFSVWDQKTEGMELLIKQIKPTNLQRLQDEIWVE